jgi:hypothetical protein
MSIEISGTCDLAFKAVRHALQENFASGDEVGEAVAVWADGRCMVDLWAGHCDEARRKPWQRDTIACMFSVGKPFAIFALLMLAERGEIDLDDPIALYWPEYARAGKEATTVRHIVSHRAGLPGVLGAKPGDAYDWNAMVRAIENEPPISVPGAEGCYHTFTLGHLAGELVRRVSGKSIGRFVREDYVDRLSCEMREMVMAVCQENNIELYATYRSEREDWIQGMVLANMGFAFMPEYSVTSSGMLSRPLIDPEVTRTVKMAWMPGRPHTPAGEAFVRAVQAYPWSG